MLLRAPHQHYVLFAWQEFQQVLPQANIFNACKKIRVQRQFAVPRKTDTRNLHLAGLCLYLLRIHSNEAHGYN